MFFPEGGGGEKEFLKLPKGALELLFINVFILNVRQILRCRYSLRLNSTQSRGTYNYMYIPYLVFCHDSEEIPPLL